MKTFLSKWAIEEGLSGITYVAQALSDNDSKSEFDKVDYAIRYEPNCSRGEVWTKSQIREAFKVSPKFACDMIRCRAGQYVRTKTSGKLCKITKYSYDAIWDYILKKPIQSTKTIGGGFVKCDVSPRRQERALIYTGESPKKFEKYMKALCKKVRNECKQQFIFIAAWNEWEEGMYLEPDKKISMNILKQ